MSCVYCDEKMEEMAVMLERIEELEEGISLHKRNVMLQDSMVFNVDSTLWELLKEGDENE